jgi:hypothetical protein
MQPTKEQWILARPSVIGLAAAIVSVATAVAYATLAGGDLATSPRRLFVVGWLAGVAALAGAGAWSRDVRGRAIAATAAGVGMVAAGSAGLATFGLPLAVVGVLEFIGAVTSLEAAAEKSPRFWLGAAVVAIGTVVLFALGIASTPL